MAFSDAEILEHLGIHTKPETDDENESETGKPNVALADRHLDWLLSGNDDSETESAPFIGKGKRKPATKAETGNQGGNQQHTSTANTSRGN